MVAVSASDERRLCDMAEDAPFALHHCVCPKELRERLRRDPRFKRAFEALTPWRQRSYLYHFGAAKQSATRVARIEKAIPAIFEGRGFLDRR